MTQRRERADRRVQRRVAIRPKRKPCMGLLWVEKADDDRIWAYCVACKREEIWISGWQDTLWADGPMEPACHEILTLPHNFN